MSTPKSGKLFIGTSGFYYNHWVGKFYPGGLPKYKWLRSCVKKFSSSEISSSFFHLSKKTFLYICPHGLSKWYDYNYTREDLALWVKFVHRELDKNKDVYVYFNNDISGYAIQNVNLFKTMIEEVRHGYPRY